MPDASSGGGKDNSSMKLENKVVVVTGASSGMGHAIVEKFVHEGAKVVAVARRLERLEQLAASLAGEPGEVAVYAGDISDRAVNEGMIDFAVEKFGALDILVNNAGVMDDMSPIGDATDERFEKVMRVNVYGPMCAIRKAVNYFKQNNRPGNIINITSEGAEHTCAGVIYCASKAAMNSVTRNTSFMYQNDNIRCNAIAPGGINTEISTSMGMPNMAGYGRVKPVLACSPKPGTPEQIAAAALFLASDDSSYVNGVILPVDGGWCAM